MKNARKSFYSIGIILIAVIYLFSYIAPASGAQLEPGYFSTPDVKVTPEIPDTVPAVDAPAVRARPAASGQIPTTSSAPMPTPEISSEIFGEPPVMPGQEKKPSVPTTPPGKLTPDSQSAPGDADPEKDRMNTLPQAPDGWTTIMFEGFEGVFPSGSWSAYDNDGATNGEYYWDDDDYMAYSGSWSAWAANGGANGLDPASFYYPNNARSWMVYGPFSLSGASDAELQFWYWNQSEPGYDYFKWMASTNGTNFYGYQFAGDSGGWVNVNFDLTSVPTLGNLAGASQVWIAFVFNSDSTSVDDGPFVDDVLLQSYTGTSQPDISYYTPDGWSNPIVASSVSGTTTNGTLYSYQDTYVDWSVANYGGSTSTTFVSCLYLDDSQLNCWNTNGLPANYYTYVPDYVISPPPSAGWHTLRITADVNNVVAESNEGNNSWEADFYWNPPNLPDLTPYTPSGWDYPIVPSSVSGTTTVGELTTGGTYLDWAVINNGVSTSTQFYTCIYLDNTPIICSDHSSGLQGNYYSYVLDYLYTGNITAGNHTLKIIADANNNVSEANENNNSWEQTFTWTSLCPASSYSQPPSQLYGSVIPDAFPLPDEIQQNIMESRSLANASPSSKAPDRYDTSSYMAESIAVGIVLPESSGSMEDWTEAEMNCVVSKIETGLDWWKNRGGAYANLSFVYDVHKAVATQYEPIDLSDSQVGLWIAETMTQMGYNNTNYWEQVYNYTDYLRSHYNTKWAVVYFVADSSNDTDGRFKNSQYFAWTYIGGPYIIMTYDNDGWGIEDMNWVATHEFGHDFWAADQYYQAGYGGCTSTTERYGYLGVANSNCEYNNPNSVPSIMRSNEDALDAGASGQIGWKDSNSNNIYDVVDTQPGFNLTNHSPDPTTETSWSYSGYVYDQPWTHATCGTSDSCNDKDITINTITSVNFRVDGGGWSSVTAVDGAFNSDEEQISFTTPTMAAGSHTIEVQAANSRGVSRSWSDTVTIESCYTLTKNANPSYAGSVTATTPNCSGGKYTPGTYVTLTASENPGYIFSTWSGDASGTNKSTGITMTSNKSVTANFNNLAPTLSSINPTSANAGGSGFNLTLNGSNFVQGSVARWNGSDLSTTYVNSTQLTASVPASSIATAGTATVSVFNPTPGGGTSGGLTFTINNPTPSLTSISPSSATAGGSAFVLTVNGSNFVASSKVRWNGSDLTTSYINSTQLTASVSASAIATSGTASVTVFNPTPGGGSSGAQTFTINNPQPSISSLNPPSATAGGGNFTLTVNGSSFVSNSVVRWNGSDLTTTYVNSTQLTASVPASSIATAGSVTVTVFNPTPGGGTTSGLTFTINNPLPSLTSINPSSATAGGSAFVLTVDGSSFVASSKVRWNGSDLTTTYVNSTQLTASVSASAIAVGGTATITVFNPTPGGGSSGAQTFTINNPQPSISSLNPSSATAGGGNFTLTVNGSSFVGASVVRWNGSDLSTSYVSSTQLTASVPASSIATAGTAMVTVFNLTPGGGTSNGLAFNINNPTPILYSIDPSSTTAGGPGFTLTVNGSNFVTGSKVRWNGFDLATAFVNSSQLTASISASVVAAGGSVSVTVYNPTPGGGASGTQTFTVNNPSPTVSSLSPSSVTAGGGSLTLIVNGTNFVTTSIVRLDGTDLDTTFINSQQLSATIPGNSITTAGTKIVTVFNSTPGGGLSSGINLNIINPVPTLISVTPPMIPKGSKNVTITVIGTMFVNGSTIRWNGVDLVTTYINSTTLTAVVPDAYLTSTGSASITVYNPTPGGGTSTALEAVIGYVIFLPILIK